MYVCMYVCMYVRTYVCMYVGTYVRTSVYAYTCIYGCISKYQAIRILCQHVSQKELLLLLLLLLFLWPVALSNSQHTNGFSSSSPSIQRRTDW